MTKSAHSETNHTIHAAMYQRVMVLLLTSGLPYLVNETLRPAT
jgi:hypothetical protein